MLKVQALSAGYGLAMVVRNVSLEVGQGELVSVLGRNGSGRSTLAKALVGLIPRTGRVLLDGHDLSDKPTHAVARAGLGYVPETRDVFPQLTVHENLRMGVQRHTHGTAYWDFAQAYARFPQLLARRDTAAGVLSGGEQQMLSLARTLMGNPRCVVLDEPLEGLSPHMVQAMLDCLAYLQSQGVAVLLIAQKLASVQHDGAKRVLVLGQGGVVFDGTASALAGNAAVRRQWLEV